MNPQYYTKTRRMREESDSEWECPACAGPVVPMGTLGKIEHGKCRNCGWTASRNAGASDDSEVDESVEGLLGNPLTEEGELALTPSIAPERRTPATILSKMSSLLGRPSKTPAPAAPATPVAPKPDELDNFDSFDQFEQSL